MANREGHCYKHMATKNILIVEDELIVALNIQVKLRQLGYDAPRKVTSGEQALELVREQRPDLILMDIKLAGNIDGIEAARLIQAEANVPVVYLTAHADEATLQRAKATAPFGYIVKPFEPRDLSSAIEMALYRHKLEERLTESEHRYRIVSEMVSDFAYSARLNEDGTLDIEWVTDAIVDISGFSFAEIDERGGWLTLIHPPDMPIIQDQVMSLLANQQSVSEFRLITKGGDLRWLRNCTRPVVDRASGRVTQVIGAATDITERKCAEERVQQMAHRAQALANLSRVTAEAGLNHEVVSSAASRHMAETLGDACVIAMLSSGRNCLNTVCLYHRSPQARALLGETVCRSIGVDDCLPDHSVDSIVGQVARSGQPMLLQSVGSGTILANLRHDFGPYVDAVGISSLIVVPLRTDGEVLGTLGVARDRSGNPYVAEDLAFVQEVADRVALAIKSARLHESLQRELAERRRAEERLAYLSSHDVLTGLHNRAYFDEEMERLQHSHCFPISVVVMDVDGLKQKNDTQGHAGGDQLLRQAADLLRSVFRPEDVVARIGGDEFAVWLPNTDAEGAAQAVHRLHESLLAHAEQDPRARVGLSVGAATAYTGDSLPVAMGLADAAMYQDKRERRVTHPVVP